MYNACLTSNSDLWATPQDLFDKLNDEFHFNLDPCSDDLNFKCSNHFTLKENGLFQDWSGHTVFCNPPYSCIKEWVKKCYDEWLFNDITIVLLIPARTDTIYFHQYIYPFCELRFIKGRLHFNNSKNSAPFPSMLCIFRSTHSIHYDHRMCDV